MFHKNSALAKLIQTGELIAFADNIILTSKNEGVLHTALQEMEQELTATLSTRQRVR